MIRVFHITAMIQTGLPSEFDVSKVIPYTMTLTHIKTSLRNGEGYLYLSVSPDICEGIDVGVLSDIALNNVIPKGTEVRVRGVYTGRYNLDMSADFPLPLSIALIGTTTETTLLMDSQT